MEPDRNDIIYAMRLKNQIDGVIVQDGRKRYRAFIQKFTNERFLITLYEEDNVNSVLGSNADFSSKSIKSYETLAHDMLSSISHALRNPLNDIINSTAVMKYSVESLNKPELIAKLNMIDKSSFAILKEITNINEYNKLTSNKYPLNLQPINVNLYLNNIFSTSQQILRTSDVSFEYTLGKNMLTTQADIERMSLIIMNIISNATIFNSEKRIIKAQVITDKTEYTIKISDNGYGIEESRAAKIYKPYYSYDPVKKAPVGAGLGLCVTDLAVRHHHGKIFLNTKPGEGTEFTLKFPVLKSDNRIFKEDYDKYPINLPKIFLYSLKLD